MSDTYIAYARDDREFVRQFVAALQADGCDCAVNWEDSAPSTAFWDRTCAAIDAADLFVFIISPDSLSSPVCHTEIMHATLQRKRLAPVLYREVNPDAAFAHLVTPTLEDATVAQLDGQSLMTLAQKNWELLSRYPVLHCREEEDFPRATRSLRRLLDTDRAHVRQHTRLLVAGKAWQASPDDPRLVLRGEDLQAAEVWLTEGYHKEPAPLDVHYQFIQASRTADRARGRQIVTGLAVGLVILALLLAAAVVLNLLTDRGRAAAEDHASTAEALVQAAGDDLATAEAERESAQTRAVGVQALLALDGPDPDLPALLAVEALENYPYTWQAERALGLALVRLEPPRLIEVGEPLAGVAWSADGAVIVTTTGAGEERPWEVEADAANDADVPTPAPPDDSRRFVFVASGRVEVEDAASGDVLLTLNGHDGPVYAAAWSSDRALLATASDDGTARIWDAASGAELLSLSGHDGAVDAVAWLPNPDGKRPLRVVTGGDDGTARIWDAATGAELLTLTGHAGAVTAVAWSMDGGRILTAGADGTARLWHVWPSMQALVDEARACCVARELTAGERAAFGLPLR
ncbi:MAG: TIR domain-containing protein [Anaerolineae bacterium]|nr:TIR domain-containing protein [Anaerolineae bacterium]